MKLPDQRVAHREGDVRERDQARDDVQVDDLTRREHRRDEHQEHRGQHVVLRLLETARVGGDRQEDRRHQHRQRDDEHRGLGDGAHRQPGRAAVAGEPAHLHREQDAGEVQEPRHHGAERRDDELRARDLRSVDREQEQRLERSTLLLARHEIRREGGPSAEHRPQEDVDQHAAGAGPRRLRGAGDVPIGLAKDVVELALSPDRDVSPLAFPGPQGSQQIEHAVGCLLGGLARPMHVDDDLRQFRVPARLVPSRPRVDPDLDAPAEHRGGERVGRDVLDEVESAALDDRLAQARQLAHERHSSTWSARLCSFFSWAVFVTAMMPGKTRIGTITPTNRIRRSRRSSLNSLRTRARRAGFTRRPPPPCDGRCPRDSAARNSRATPRACPPRG